ncbi:MAG: hypothetical protein H6Q04_1842 [Acidobacteria bacterium]|nr:hypothetical protein [Acidobacteriota bacterium]
MQYPFFDLVAFSDILQMLTSIYSASGIMAEITDEKRATVSCRPLCRREEKGRLKIQLRT